MPMLSMACSTPVPRRPPALFLFSRLNARTSSSTDRSMRTAPPPPSTRRTSNITQTMACLCGTSCSTFARTHSVMGLRRSSALSYRCLCPSLIQGGLPSTCPSMPSTSGHVLQNPSPPRRLVYVSRSSFREMLKHTSKNTSADPPPSVDCPGTTSPAGTRRYRSPFSRAFVFFFSFFCCCCLLLLLFSVFFCWLFEAPSFDGPAPDPLPASSQFPLPSCPGGWEGARFLAPPSSSGLLPRFLFSSSSIDGTQ